MAQITNISHNVPRFFVTKLKLRKPAFSSCITCKNTLKNIISRKHLKMRMCHIKLFVYLTIDYTITGNSFVLILKLRVSALQGTLFRQISEVWAKILAENCKQVQISEDDWHPSEKLLYCAIVAQDFPDCQHPISYAPRISLSYDKVKRNIADGSMSNPFFLQASEFGSLTIKR